MNEFILNLLHNFNTIVNNIKSKTTTPTTNPTVIDLSNLNVVRVTPHTKHVTSILANGFVNKGAPEFNTALWYANNPNGYFGDDYIPIKNITTYYGVEDGKLKTGTLGDFDESTVVMPNRGRHIGKISEVISSPIGTGLSYITISGDTIPESKLGYVGPKRLFADENGNAVFTSGVNPEILTVLNNKLKTTPLYPTLIDNGRYKSYLVDKPTWKVYTSTDWSRDGLDLYAVGTASKGLANYLNVFPYYE